MPGPASVPRGAGACQGTRPPTGRNVDARIAYTYNEKAYLKGAGPRMAGELYVNVALARPVIPRLATEQLVYALVTLRPTEQAVPVAMPLNLSLVLDRSGSMQGKKIEALRAATQELID